MGQISLDSISSGGRLPRTVRGNWTLRIVLYVGLGFLSLVSLIMLQTREPLSVGSVLLKPFLEDVTIQQQYPLISNGQRLVSCDDVVLDAHGGRDDTEKLMNSIRHWPKDQDYNTPDHCIYSVAEYSMQVTQCQCRNPTIPLPRTAEFWQHAFQRNQRLAKEAAATVSLEGRDLDVIILGDSIVEHWIGQTGGRANSAYYENSQAFRKVLTRKGGGSVDALALGIAADKIPNLLFRLQAARYGQYIQPRLWWILIGTNDLAMGWCNVDTVLAGNIAIVEEIQQTQPGAVVVINSVLPRLPEPLLPHIDELNQRLRNYACEAKDVYFFDATSIFRDESSGETRHLPDGVHPNGEASWIWANEISKAVEELNGSI